MNLVIVESPAKCKTIGNYLGSDYVVESSIGHIRDLSMKGKGGFGVDINNNFAPEYVVLKDKEEFFKRIDNGEFLEYVNYGENYYGTLKCEINRLLEAGKIIVMVIEVCGALNIKKAFPDSTSIFLLPPSVEVLSERLRSRGQNSEEDINIRLSIAMDEMKQKDNYDYCVINDDLKTCVDEINAIIQK